MNPKQKIQVAKDFIAMHKDDDVIDWFLMLPGTAKTEEEKFIQIYNRLEFGTYGEARDNAEYDDDGEIISPATEFEIEIGRFDSKTGNPVMFEWEV